MAMDGSIGFAVEDVSSEHQDYPASSLCDAVNTTPWTSATSGQPEIHLVLKLNQPSKIAKIVVRNNFSGLLEVFGQEGASKKASWKSVVSKSSLMTPGDSRAESNGDAERELILKLEDRDTVFSALKFVCQQPFNKKLSYGLTKILLVPQDEAPTRNGSHKAGGIVLKKKEKSDDFKPGDLFSTSSKVDVGASVSQMKISDETLDAVASVRKSEVSPLRRDSSDGDRPDAVAAVSKPLRVKKRTKSVSGDEDEGPSTSTAKRARSTKKIADEKAGGKGSRKKSPSKSASRSRKATKHAASDSEEEETPASRKTKGGRNGKKAKKDTPKTSGQKRSQKKSVDADVDEDEDEPTPSKKKKAHRGSATASTADILKGVVFALSGFVNPERSELREKACEMGAKYRSDWTPDCNTLICAFANTPKFAQVRTAGGRVMKKEWLDACMTAKRMMPWRNYMLKPVKSSADDEDDEDELEEAKFNEDEEWEPAASSSESDAASSSSEEVLSEELESDVSEVDEDEISGVEDDDLEEDAGSEASVKKRKPPAKKSPKKKPAKRKRKGAHSDTDSEDSAQLNLTDASESDVDEKKLAPRQLALLRGKHFFVYGGLEDAEEKRLRKSITVLGGSIREYNDEKVTHCVTNLPWSADFDSALSDNPKLLIVTPEWIDEAEKSRTIPDAKKFRPKS